MAAGLPGRNNAKTNENPENPANTAPPDQFTALQVVIRFSAGLSGCRSHCCCIM